MLKRIFGTALVLSVLPATASALPDANQIEFSNCTLTLPGTHLTADARCGFLDVPENPAEPDGKTISLHVAVAGATGKAAKPDPVFFFAGGPGQAASETWVMIRPVLNQIRKKRDIVMVDQRGTGQSNKLACKSELTDDLNQEIDLGLVRSETEKCLADLPGDPRFYTTSIAMADYDAVRRAMGYDKINIMGIAPLIVREIYLVIQQLNESGTTVLLVEQNARAALKVAHHSYVLEWGEIVMEGLAEELLDNPKVKEVYLGG